jgi:hypothetical protein
MLMPENPVRAARRKVELAEKLGTAEVRCIYCGCTDPMLVRPQRIQAHHLFGRKRDAMTAFACMNCHAGAHEGLRDAEVPMTCEKDPRLLARAIFRTLAVHFMLLAEACKRFAKRME